MTWLKKYKPEIIASIALIAYTIVRTILVAETITPVSQVRWEIFLAIEIITTPPYVWGVGYLVRSALDTHQMATAGMRTVAYIAVVLSFCAPYAYLVYYGTLQTEQGAVGLIILLLLFLIPKFAKRLRRRSINLI